MSTKCQNYLGIGYPVGTAVPSGIPEPDPPFQGNLTIVWEQEKEELFERLRQLTSRVATLEARFHVMELAITTQGVSSRQASPKG